MASVSHLAWFSHVIVVGTAVSRSGPYVFENDGRSVIASDVVITVETPVRGMLDDPTTIKVRQLGGTIGDCMQVYEGDPSFAIGDRVLLFLTADPRGPLDSGRLWPTGHLQGVWQVADDGTVVNAFPNLQTSPQPLGDMLDLVVAALQGAPASGPAARHFLVPLDEAPLIMPGVETPGDVDTATPSP